METKDKALSLEGAKRYVLNPLNEAINAEQTARISADNAIASNLAHEVSARERTDRSLEMLWKATQGIAYTEEESVSTDYEKPIPSGVVGFRLNEIGGRTRKTKNICPIASICSRNISLNTPVIAGHTYTLSFINRVSADEIAMNIRLDSASGQLVKTVYNISPNVKKATTFTPSASGTIFLNGTYWELDFAEIQIEESSTATDYEPYFDGLKSAEVQSVDVRGKNMLVSTEENPNYTQTITGTKTYDDSRFSFDYASCEEGETYTVSFDLSKGTKAYVDFDMIAFYDENHNYIDRVYRNSGKIPMSMTAPTGSRFVKYQAQLNGIGKVTYKTFEDYAFMLERSSSASAYSPHSLESRPIPEAVKALSGYGLGISDNLCNVVDFKNKIYTKLVGKVDFTAETLFRKSGTNNFYYSDSVIDGAKPRTINLLMSSSVEIGDTAGIDNGNAPDRIGIANDGRLHIGNNVFANRTSLIDGQSLIYELAAVEPENISDLLAEFDNGFVCEAGGSITFAQDDVIKIPVPNKETFVVKTAEAI